MERALLREDGVLQLAFWCAASHWLWPLRVAGTERSTAVRTGFHYVNYDCYEKYH